MKFSVSLIPFLSFEHHCENSYSNSLVSVYVCGWLLKVFNAVVWLTYVKVICGCLAALCGLEYGRLIDMCVELK